MESTGVGGKFLSVFFIIFGTLSAISNAYTVIYTSPTTDLTLRLSDQPFHVNNSIPVPPGVTLNVEPGVTVKFGPAVGVRVEGRLLAVGQPDKRILFTAADEPNVERDDKQPPIWFDGARLAGDFTESHHGRLELLYQGSFGTVCRNGWDSSYYYNINNNNRVVARMLGYKTCTKVYNRGSGTGSILLNNVRCDGHESSLWDCPHDGVRVHNCFHSQDVWLQCSGYSGYRGIANETAKYWSGIELVTNSSVKGISDLQYVDIEFAGLPNIGTHSNDTAAISISGIPPVLDNLNITNVIGNGVLLRDITGHAAINNSSIENSMGNGVSFRSYGGNLALDNVQISNAHKAGLYYNRTFPLPSYKMCQLPETTVPDGEPLIVSFDSTDLHLGSKSSCSQVFRSQKPGYILAVRVLYIRARWYTRRNVLDIFDGNSSSSRRLERVYTYGAEVNMPSPLYTTGGSVLLSFSRLDIGSSERYQGMFTVQSVAAYSGHPTGLSMNSVKVTKSGYGTFIENQLQPIGISGTRVAHSSETGLYVGKGSGTFVLQDSAFVNNMNHVYFEHIQRNVTVKNSELIISSNYALSVGTTPVWTLSDKVSFIIQNNTLMDNTFGISVLRARQCALTDNVSDSVFHNQSETALKLGSGSVCGTNRLRTIQVNKNYISKTKGTAVLLIETDTQILNNTSDNDVSQCVLCISASSVFVTGNKFRNNNVRTENKRHKVGAIMVLIKFPSSFTFTDNVFENLLGEYLLTIWYENSVLRTLDVSRNYWGTPNPQDVYLGIIDNTKRYTLRTQFLYTQCTLRTQFLFYITSDLSSLSPATIEVDPAPTPHTLGGRIYTDLTLKDTGRPYTVTHDLNVTANATLTIEPGVVLEFEDSVGMYIEGRLNVSGTEGKKCIFTARGKLATTNVIYKSDFGKFSLLRGPSQSYDAASFYGLLYGEENGDKLPVCYDSSLRGPMLTTWLDGECRRLGYTSLRHMSSISDTAKLGLKLNCAGTETDFENNCFTGMQRYRCTSFFRVVCTKHSRETTWAGIRLGLTARPSSIQHAVMQFAGYFDSGSRRKGPSLQVDFNRHIVDNVVILTSGGGIRQLYVEQSMTNMVIADIDNNAFETYTLSATLRDSRREDINSYAVLFQSGQPSRTMTAYFTPYKEDCGVTYLASEGDMVPFHQYINTRTQCGTFTTRSDLRLRVFIIYPGYHDFKLLLTDTVKNWTVGLNSLDSVITTSTNTLQFLKGWRNSCTWCYVDVNAIVMAVKDDLPPY
ncbi:protein bark beetle [Lingula anatina]|uniref:Protein bark beetle n=1 Tax=Lingula anatina TaxID=7574 RepID=A0A1S3KI20_LINAN|nr:protein bark beetle [Lingula anatina]|eukprot:XP_013422119.1 protein bark beetle [Lingula anatina]